MQLTWCMLWLVPLLLLVEGYDAAAEAEDCQNAFAATGMQLLQTQVTVHRGAADDIPVPFARLEPLLLKQPYNESSSATSDTHNAQDAASVVGVRTNSAGDFRQLMIAVGTSSFFLFLAVCCQEWCRPRFPLIYNYPEMCGQVPQWEARSSWMFGFLHDGFRLTVDEIQEHANLDHAMLIEFSHMAMKIMFVAGVLNLAVLGFLFALLGEHTGSEDLLALISPVGMSSNSWIWWLVAAVVLTVVFTVDFCVQQGMESFIDRRTRWLKEMPSPQDTTILIRNIPKAYRSDVVLTDYINKGFDRNVVQAVHVIKDAQLLVDIRERKQEAVLLLKQAEEKMQKEDGDSRGSTKEAADEAAHYKSVLVKLEDELSRERSTLLKDLETPSKSSVKHFAFAFVTFKARRDAEMGLSIPYVPDSWKFMAMRAPDPSDVIYSDLQVDSSSQRCSNTTGYLLLALVFILYLPVTSLLSVVTSLDNLRKVVPYVAEITRAAPILAELWDAYIGSIVLQMILGCLPLIILGIHKFFFQMFGTQGSQLEMQRTYYQFQVVYVLLVTAIGSSLVTRVQDLINNPSSVIDVLATSLPASSHFYLIYIATYWATHASSFSRYWSLGSYLLHRTIYAEEDARELAEPEDQTVSGMGGRSATFSLILAIGLVFSTISPPVCLLCFLNFALARLLYGYLFVFNEDRSKADQGGAFFVIQMHHLYQAMIIYLLLMTGLLWRWSSSFLPGLIVLASLVYLAWCYRAFQAIRWESLTLEAMGKSLDVTKRQSKRTTYMQPELCDD
mmetsp:Transcript_25718/g.59996  ORF Transcript_25718/g.59996 Transcript_25718/m.59996 type:complete len:784 (+) Transcript_25718:129-2480(+)